MRNLFASTCLTPIAFGILATPVAAATVTIGGAQTTPVATATANAGTPADISITSAGSIKPASGTAVTINSNNSVTNAGTIDIEDANGAIGILANAGVTGSITNSGTITVSEAYKQTDTNGDGVLDGPFAQGSGRYGIRTAGAFTGSIANTGSITVHGNSSAGISLGGPLTGNFSTSTGTISVVGDNSTGISTGDVSGNVTLAGTISAIGQNSSAVVLGGNIGGALQVQGAIGSTGYTSTSLPTDTSKLTAGNLLQGGPALVVGGDVAGGVVLTAATTASGSTPATTAASVSSYGSAAALQIGAANRSVTIGAVAGDTAHHGLVINGAVSASGVYSGISATAIRIGGLGGAVNVSGGMAVGGTVTAISNGGSATGIHVGSGASLPAFNVTGTVSASGGNASGNSNSAILIDAGATTPALTNSGAIGASAGAPASGATAAGTVTAIADRSGTLTSLTNSGKISATGGLTNVAIDLSAATAATTISQPAPASGAAAASISGDVRFGSGDDRFLIAGGTVTGNTSFGGGANTLALSGAGAYTGNATFGAGNDAMSLAGTSHFTGTADFGGGADSLTIGDTAVFSGTLAHANGLAVAVTGGTLGLTNTGAVAIGSLAVSGGGTIGATIDPTSGAATLYQVAGNASFASGSKIALGITDVAHSVGTYRIVQAGTMTGGANISTAAVLPYLYSATVTANDAAGTVDVTVARKTAAQLGLNRSEAAAYDAVYAAISGDRPIGNTFLAATDGASIRQSIEQMLPDHSGGAFETVTEASRATARFLADPDAPIVDQGSWGFWLQQVGWGRTKALGDTSGYHVSGWGVSGGAEIGLGGAGRFGLSLAYLAGRDDADSTANQVSDNQYELGGYWRGDWGGFHAFARGSYALVKFSDQRRFAGVDGGSPVVRIAKGSWNGQLVSGSGGVSYRLALGSFSLRPQASIDYYRLHEGHYAETGGGAGYDLTVDGRNSDELAASAALALGYSLFDDLANDGGYLRAEIEGGRRQVIGGSLGATTARFAGGNAFTLLPDDQTSGWTGAVRLKGGSSRYTLTGEVDAEQRSETGDHVAVAFRAGLQIGF